MSGPKYCNFPMSSPEEAAGVYSQLSAFQPGVIVRVVNNELQFTVSNAAWYEGATFSAISARVDSAKARYIERVLKERKKEEKDKIRNKKSELEAAYGKERAKLEKALAQCRDIEKQSRTQVSTPFGTYGLSCESKKVGEAIRKITARLSALETESRDALKKCDKCLSAVDSCDAVQNLTKIQREYNALYIIEFVIDFDVEKQSASIQSKLGTLKSFVRFLEQLYGNCENAGKVDRFRT